MLKIYAGIGTVSLTIGALVGSNYVLEKNLENYKNAVDYVCEQDQQIQYLSERNKRLYQAICDIYLEESQNLSVEGKKKLDEIIDITY